MMRLISKLWTGATAWLGLNRSYLTLLVVAIAGAWIYTQLLIVRADRARLLAWADTSCAAAGSSFTASSVEITLPNGLTAKAKKLKRGEACAVKIAELATFKRETTEQTARLLLDELAAHNRKTNADARAAAIDAAAARAAAERMEAADAAIGDDDRVGGAWFDALNQSAGLQQPR